MPSPGQRSIQQNLRKNLILFNALVLLIVVAAAFFISTFYSARLVTSEMMAQANIATVSVTDFHSEMEDALLSFDNQDDLLDGAKVNRRVLSRLYRSNQHYDQVFVADDEQNVAASFPSAETEIILTNRELNAVSKTLAEGTRELILDVGEDGDPGISVVIPVVGDSGDSVVALIGRLNKSFLANILLDLTKNNHNRSGAIVDLEGEPIFEVGAEDSSWSGAALSQIQSLVLPDDFKGTALLGKSDPGAPHLIYLAPSGNRDWRIAVSIPLAMILRNGIAVAVILGGVLFVVASLFYTSMNNYGRDLSQSITELTLNSRKISAGGSLAPWGGNGRQDELGELSQAVDDMRRRLKKRLEEQSLLLSVSQESSASFELTDSLPVVLHGALRGTGAAGVRGLVLNPGGGRPVPYAEGPAAESMQVFDTKLLSLMRQEEELILSSPRTIYDQLEIASSAEIPVKALYALPLQVEKKFLGFLVLGFRNQREFTEDDLTFLRSLARQSSILVQKSYLYTYAEGGRKRLTAVLDSTSDPVIVTDPTSRILRINRAMEQAFELEAGQVVGRKVADVIDSPALVNALISEETGSRDLEIMGKDDCTYFANTSLIISRDRQALGRVAVLHDVTQLKVIDRLKTEFIDNVSHDLRTPLTVLSGYTSALALLDDLTPEQREYTDNILHSVERIVELVEDLLDLGKIEAGVDQIFEDVEIGPLLQDLADENWLYAHESGVRLRVRFADDLPLVCCDRVLVRRAVSNLLMNGFKYAPNSGDITLAAELSDDALLISVRDRGPGIAREDQLRLFEKFYRVNRHGDGAVKGTGLGLATVRSIAERHGGRAWCKSAPEKGSTFYLSLPLENQSASLT